MPYKSVDSRKSWEKQNVKTFSIRCTKSEQDMKEWLEKHKPYQPYLKNLVREDMNRQK